jgi:FKBP-type peptidyl-prolyl cis-trans isomerase 2
MATFNMNLKVAARTVGGDGNTYVTLVDSETPGPMTCGSGYFITKLEGDVPGPVVGDDVAVTIDDS